MRAELDLQIVWNENKGEVQLFIGDFRIGLPPASCEQLEKELAAARRTPHRAATMTGVLSDAAAIAAWGGDAEASDGA